MVSWQHLCLIILFLDSSRVIHLDAVNELALILSFSMWLLFPVEFHKEIFLARCLFLIFINGLVNFSSHPFIFAFVSKCSSKDYTAVQHDIDSIYTWCFSNDLQLHPMECKIMQFFEYSSEQHFLCLTM